LKAEHLSLSLDLAFLDDDHSEAAVAKDFGLVSQ
jgi:hypothetical protein